MKFESVFQAIRAWGLGNTDDVIDFLQLATPNVVALFCREFVFGAEALYGDDMGKREEQLNVICNRLMDRYQRGRVDLTDDQKRSLGLLD